MFNVELNIFQQSNYHFANTCTGVELAYDLGGYVRDTAIPAAADFTYQYILPFLSDQLDNAMRYAPDVVHNAYQYARGEGHFKVASAIGKSATGWKIATNIETFVVLLVKK